MPICIPPPAEAAPIDLLEAGPSTGIGEGAHDGCVLEWWFFHGRYRSEARGERTFMVTLFRYHGRENDREGVPGHQLLVAVLDPDAAAHRAATWVDPSSLRLAADFLEASEAFLAPVMRKALVGELRHHGPPHPVMVPPEPIVFQSAPLSVAWGELGLRETLGGWTLRFREPGPGGALVDLLLVPSRPAAEVECYPGMACRSCPRMGLTGTSDHKPLAGQGWMDHQWGTTGWMIDSSKEVVLGWDWFGINLDDGSDWIVTRHRDARSGDAVAAHAMIWAAGGGMRSATEVVLRPVRHWESPRTRIRYPVEWEVGIPGLGATFTFRPLADDQELAVLGSPRAVWEGAGRVSGSVEGTPVSGRARGEFHGYGYLFDPGEIFRSMTARIERRIEEFLPRRFGPAEVERFVGAAAWRHEPQALTETVARPVWDLLDRRKKCWRPLFGLLLLEAFGAPSEPYEDLVSVLAELLHTAALIVDDIEDGSLLRRGEECIHLRYGVDVALNAANLLYFLPGLVIIEHPALTEDNRARLLQLKERVCIEAHCGQAADIHWSKHLSEENLAAWLVDDLEAKILQMYVFKTGAATVWLAELAVLIADQGPQVRAAALGFARRFAVAFQVVDDIHDFSRSEKWTKSQGEDLANGKLTYVIATALRMLAPERTARLASILCSPGLRTDPVVREEGIGLVMSSGAMARCREWARRETEESWNDFSRVVPSSEPKILLHALCLKLLDLTFEE